MTFPIVYSEHVESDIDSALGYIINKLHNAKAARDLFDEISKLLEHLGETPEMFPYHENRWLAGMGIRKANIRGYNMFYLFDGKAVIAVRFASTLKDVSSPEFINSVMRILGRMLQS